MSRYFTKKLTKEELKLAILKKAKSNEETNIIYVTKKIAKDLLKVNFAIENMTHYINVNYTDIIERKFGNIKDILGFQTLDNGLTFLGMLSGGDWEIPVYFIIYSDGNILRAYIPSDGNYYNSDTNEAYGNADEALDIRNAQKRFGYHITEQKFADGELMDSATSTQLIKADILRRIKWKNTTN